MFKDIASIFGTIFILGLFLLIFVLSFMFFGIVFVHIKGKIKLIRNRNKNPISKRTRMRCKNCRCIISIEAIVCPHCGEDYEKPSYSFFAIIIYFIFGCGFMYIGLLAIHWILSEGFSLEDIHRIRRRY
ncbi:hypothetical protein MH215_17775 [Paenibacillus sp. ACRSA]|uniref:hypothetical protein n=1 Tax=Paenibacillus sp. ACRSA TaxID=2918211 RepID=UPI001EF66EC2|nr:hypothetical protein [Paenibacillus sp. ACRSA]MCG7378863.1 hypothetical protein [Paenibacillus sp. ACRSA]